MESKRLLYTSAYDANIARTRNRLTRLTNCDSGVNFIVNVDLNYFSSAIYFKAIKMLDVTEPTTIRYLLFNKRTENFALH